MRYFGSLLILRVKGAHCRSRKGEAQDVGRWSDVAQTGKGIEDDPGVQKVLAGQQEVPKVQEVHPLQRGGLTAVPELNGGTAKCTVKETVVDVVGGERPQPTMRCSSLLLPGCKYHSPLGR